MAPPREVELKFEVQPAHLARVARLPMLRALEEPPSTETIVSVYFDTDGQRLRRNGLLLRVRRIGERYIQTVKAVAGAGPFERGEWESDIDSELPDLRRARETALKPYLDRKLCSQLKPMFETRVQRRTYCLADDERAIEVNLDRGRIDTGERSQPLCEIELELERGLENELFLLARQLVDALPAELALRSKPERGYALIDEAEVAAVKAAAIELDSAMSASAGFRAIGGACLRQIVDNLPALRAGEPEGVHQMRVGLRRLRAAISLFGGILTDPETAVVKRELKWLTGELAPARELEVLEKRVLVPLKRQHARMRELGLFSRELAARRASAMQRAKEAVGSPRFRRLLLDVAAWLETGHWMRPQNDLARDRAALSIAVFAANELKRRWKKLRKKGKALRELDRRGRHKLRIQGKKLRYASQFLGSLFTGKRAPKRRKAFMARLKSLQNALGDLNDIAVHEDLLSADARVEARRKRGDSRRAFAAGLLMGREDARKEPALDAAVAAHATLLKSKPFW